MPLKGEDASGERFNSSHALSENNFTLEAIG